MKTFSKLLLLCCVVALALPSCVSSKKFNELQAEKDAMSSALSEAQNQIQGLTEDKEALEAQTADLNSQVADIASKLDATNAKVAAVEKSVAEKEAQLAAVKKSVGDALTTYKATGLEAAERNGYYYLTAPNKIMYRSGSARISKDGKAILENLAAIFAKNPNVAVVIGGHTDNQPIASGRYANNWDLSASRANKVVSHLIKNGVAATQLIPVGYADTRPSADGDQDDPENRKMNRRTEFIILPDVESMFKIISE